MPFHLCINYTAQPRPFGHLRSAKRAALRQFTLQDMQEKRIEIIEVGVDDWADRILHLWKVTPAGFIPLDPKEA